eukprot:3256952-Amphidinium_carterae.1
MAVVITVEVVMCGGSGVVEWRCWWWWKWHGMWWCGWMSAIVYQCVIWRNVIHINARVKIRIKQMCKGQ